MELIDRYVHAVGKRIFKKNRSDIEKELKSLILDQLDARTKGVPPSEEDIIAVLKEMGHPSDVAARYNSDEKGLIGPRLLGTYYLVLKIVLGATALGLFISTLVRIIETPYDAGMILLRLVGEAFGGAMGAIGWVTVIFYIIERTVPEFKGIFTEKNWNPKELPPVPKSADQIKLSESIAAMVFITAAIIVFNFFFEKLGIYFMPKESSLTFWPLIDKGAYLSFLPYWNMLWVLEFIRHLLLVVLGREVLGTRVLSLILPVLSIIVISIMLGGPSIVGSGIPQPDFMHGSVTLNDILQTVYRVVLILALVGSVADFIKRIISLIKSLHQGMQN